MTEKPLLESFTDHIEAFDYKFWWNLNDFASLMIAEGIDAMLQQGTTLYTEVEYGELARLRAAFHHAVEQYNYVISPEIWLLLGRWWPRLWD